MQGLAVKPVNANGFEDGIAGLLVDDMKKIVEARTESRVEPDRATDALGSPETNYPNVETAHGPMMNPDIAVKPTCFVGSNVLVPSSTAMSWQSMQLAKVSSTLLPKVINETHMHKIKPAGDSRTFCVHGHHATRFLSEYWHSTNGDTCGNVNLQTIYPVPTGMSSLTDKTIIKED